MDNIFWKNDISILYKNSNYKNFLPRSECNLNENLNRFTRLSFYYFFILYLYNDDLLNNLIGFLISCIIFIFLYNRYSLVENFTSNINKNKIYKSSTKNNPMMNLSVYDYGKHTDGADLSDINIDKNILGDNLQNTQETKLLKRQFYTMPVTSNPDNRHEFLEFLKGDKTCKEDTSQCVKTISDRLQYGRVN